jgi:hypothetical protein
MDFVAPMFDLPEVGSLRFSWLAEPLSLDELEATLDQCYNSCQGLDELRFSFFKALPLICTRYDFWAEKNGMLSPTQYGIRKGTGTRDCLVMLTTDISTSFEMKRQTMAAFLDISGAYDNVLIDVLCGVMLEKELLLGIVRFMWSLLLCKTLVSCVGDAEYDLSVLNPFLYNLLGSGMDRFVPSGCDFLQYAVDIVVYSSHHVLQTTCALVQSLNFRRPARPQRFFLLLGLTIFSTKSEVVFFSRKLLRPLVSIRIGGRLFPQVLSFKYL